MSLLPYPPEFSGRLSLAAAGNRSLLFDRAMDRYEIDPDTGRWKIAEGGKDGFLQTFVHEFRGHRDPEDFRDFIARRSAALEKLSAKSVQMFTRSRLLIGLGLPHPIETGFLFDRLTGCPYLPGSSVKGLLRATARLVLAQEIEGDRDFWTREQIVRIFGPELAAGVTPQTGCIAFYDAFPTAWPELEVDVLTPHHGKYYRDPHIPPADWEQPVPVPFLAIQAGTSFRFHFASRAQGTWEEDFARLQSLLRLGLDWLGLGAKKAAGYGLFTKDRPVKSPKRNGVPPPPPPPAELRWTGVDLGWHQSSPAVIRGKQVVPFSRDLLEPDLLEALKSKKAKLKADVVVVKISGGGFRIDKIESWKKS